MRRTIDLNADLGEGCPNDAAILALVTSASICCGAHAGTEASIRATLDEAARRGVALGAHPGFADREHFGRREQAVTAVDVEHLIASQLEWLVERARDAGISLRFLKPHGALYNQAQRDPEAAEGVVRAAVASGLPVLGQPGSVLERRAAEVGLRFVREGFPDRRYQADGRLVPRTESNAVLQEPEDIADQGVRLATLGLETLCIHGDDPHAVRNAETLRRILDRDGFAPAFWG